MVEVVHSFSMFAEPFSSTPQIICSLIGTVTINGLDFIEYSGDQLEFISQFQLTDSTFYGPAGVECTTLTIAESTAYVDRVSTIEYTCTPVFP